MKAIFKAQDAAHTEKAFVHPHESAPDGWYETRAEALANWVEPEKGKKRAHNKNGTFKADDPETPENEAFED